MKAKLAIAFVVLSIGFSTLALTPKERAALMQVQTLVRLGIVENKAATDAVIQADQRAAEADSRAQASDQHAAATDQEIGNVNKQIDAAHNREVALKVDNDKMRPVYLQCTSHWGLGAIAYGVGELAKHLLIAVAVIAVLGVGLYVLSFFFPLIGVALGAVAGIIKSLFKAIASAFKRLETHLKPKPFASYAPPGAVSRTGPESPGETGPTGPTA